VLIFLNGLPSCLGETDTTASEIRETLRKSPAIVHAPDTLLLVGDGIESGMPSFSCMTPDIVCCSDISVKVGFPQELWIKLCISYLVAP
jgi:hypothetical protein